jgi:hypothetical protein
VRAAVAEAASQAGAVAQQAAARDQARVNLALEELKPVQAALGAGAIPKDVRKALERKCHSLSYSVAIAASSSSTVAKTPTIMLHDHKCTCIPCCVQRSRAT